jgi:hypothetical protein
MARSWLTQAARENGAAERVCDGIHEGEREKENGHPKVAVRRIARLLSLGW